jgi:phosphatidylserine/phosphatidylglycerophosphate/cardiolipin synthase-like enzyme
VNGVWERVDGVIGNALERATVAHHRRRLARLGAVPALDPPVDGQVWCGGDPPPRPGNELEVLIDGAAALPRIAEELAGARSHVHVAGWHVDPGFRLVRNPGSPTLRDLLGELAERVPVRVLAWAGSPLPVFSPTRRDVRGTHDALTRGTRVVCELDAHERPFHCHHEKLVIIDDRVAFVGGIDLTALAGDRFDSPQHAYRTVLGWHDATTCLRGPAVADVAEHFRRRWQEVADESLPHPRVPALAGDVEVQVLRTLPDGAYRFAPRGEFRILEAYVRALRSAQELIYIENQFLWSPELVAILADKLRRPPCPEFRLVALLPAKANNGADDTRGQLSVLADADAGAGRFLACTLYARESGSQRTAPVYVHAKIAVVDDRWLTVGSANLNAHSLFNDGEVNLVTHNRGLALRLRRQLWAEHLEADPRQMTRSPVSVIDELWKPTAAEQLRHRKAGRPLTHRLVELPGVSKRSMRLGGPLQGLIVDS